MVISGPGDVVISLGALLLMVMAVEVVVVKCQVRTPGTIRLERSGGNLRIGAMMAEVASVDGMELRDCEDVEIVSLCQPGRDDAGKASLRATQAGLDRSAVGGGAGGAGVVGFSAARQYRRKPSVDEVKEGLARKLSAPGLQMVPDLDCEGAEL
jgi:hypothetical protein